MVMVIEHINVVSDIVSEMLGVCTPEQRNQYDLLLSQLKTTGDVFVPNTCAAVVEAKTTAATAVPPAIDIPQVPGPECSDTLPPMSSGTKMENKIYLCMW